MCSNMDEKEKDEQIETQEDKELKPSISPNKDFCFVW